ncbi:MAG TPA: tRNA (adenosine(37)-N6)-threonylcarbamoyltransferase complex ATPase subunit type 1 TsaE [Longimicrobiaceae bacterium]|nr:tRNA (adenosine(37)-N6)-threonylcarbamoyltransferase complex ATPase subunit type 1 TsaE [Longimicrobiaceae bacterium]
MTGSAGDRPMIQPDRDLTEAELEEWGRGIGAEAELPTVIALRGDLGVGKSTLARAIARGAGVEGAVPSPTFNLLFRYQVPRGAVVHLDLYRLDDPEEVWDLGWSELPADDELVIIEWPERAEGLLPVPRWEVEIRETEAPSLRSVSVLRVTR